MLSLTGVGVIKCFSLLHDRRLFITLHKVETTLLGREVGFDRPGVITPVDPEY
jgi:hypothetical protein